MQRPCEIASRHSVNFTPIQSLFLTGQAGQAGRRGETCQGFPSQRCHRHAFGRSIREKGCLWQENLAESVKEKGRKI